LNFKDLHLHPSIIESIDSMGFEKATPVQEQTIPAILSGKDLIASAQTGTGKTAAFLLPVIHKILNSSHKDKIKALVIVPTRELAIQISQQMEGFAYFANVSSIAVYGGGDGDLFSREKKALIEGADIVICTPGRMISHLNLNYVNFGMVETLILDEADRMLDMGFNEDIMKIISHLPNNRQSLLFSATMPPRIRELARKILYKPLEISISISRPPENIKQGAYVVYDAQKINMVDEILSKHKELRSILIFCSTKLSVKELAKVLKRKSFKAEEIHSDLDQSKRENVLMDFKSRKLQVLVATDILSRGIDIEDIDMVINYDVPDDGEDYVHRIGRTARAESKGEAITLIGEKDQIKFSRIEKLIDKDIDKYPVPDFMGEVPTYDPTHKSVYQGSHQKRNFSNKKKGKPKGSPSNYND